MLLPKPCENTNRTLGQGCVGCPLASDFQGFVPDILVTDARVLVLAQNPGEFEEQGKRIVGYEYAGRRRVPVTEPCSPQPLIGPTGYDMVQDFFPLAGLERGSVSLANVLKCRQIVAGKRTNDLPTGKTLGLAVAHCTAAHLRIPASTQLIVAMGALAAEWTGCPGSVHLWRGFTYARR